MYSKNMQAFLDMVGKSEGTSNSIHTLNDGYDIIVTGINGKPERLTNYRDHPFANGRNAKQINEH